MTQVLQTPLRTVIRCCWILLLLSVLAGCAAGETNDGDNPDGTVDMTINDGLAEVSPDGEDDVDPGYCGDGEIQAGEECDDGLNNSDAVVDACRLDCRLPYCGDGINDSGEACDDGNDIDDDACSNECREVTSALCKPCTGDSDCGRTIDRCVALPGGSVCGVACTSNAQCPEGFECQTPMDGGTNQCLPVSGTCVDCIDADNDGYGVGPLCMGSDCNDMDPEIYTGAEEVCDGKDNNCNDQEDEGFEPVELYPDMDGDMYGDARAEPVIGCGVSMGLVANNDDCDDSDMNANPDGVESCDGLDNDCNGLVDDNASCPCETRTHDGIGYMFCPGPVDWSSASASCMSSGYHLAALNDGVENGWVGQEASMVLGMCDNSCIWSDDGVCDDGGPMSIFSVCDLGTDCMDCGSRPAERAWVGLTDDAGSFVWENGEALSWTRWAPGQPDGGACGELLLGSNEWNDESCSRTQGFICESLGTTVPID